MSRWKAREDVLRRTTLAGQGDLLEDSWATQTDVHPAQRDRETLLDGPALHETAGQAVVDEPALPFGAGEERAI